MNNAEILEKVGHEMREQLAGEGSGHDWFHIERVRTMAKRIGAAEEADLFVVELAALLHDIADWKFTDGDDTVGPAQARKVMERHGVDAEIVEHVCAIIASMSFKGAKVSDDMPTIEGKCVQDADRLDAIGAIGVARTFAYGGHKGRLLHDPSVPPVLHDDKHAYVKNTAPTLNHFYEKLFLLKDRMKTKTGRAIAEERDAFMHAYVDQFLAEWDGTR
jgi:uncharacterized protein